MRLSRVNVCDSVGDRVVFRPSEPEGDYLYHCTSWVADAGRGVGSVLDSGVISCWRDEWGRKDCAVSFTTSPGRYTAHLGIRPFERGPEYPVCFRFRRVDVPGAKPVLYRYNRIWEGEVGGVGEYRRALVRELGPDWRARLESGDRIRHPSISEAWLHYAGSLVSTFDDHCHGMLSEEEASSLVDGGEMRSVWVKRYVPDRGSVDVRESAARVEDFKENWDVVYENEFRVIGDFALPSRFDLVRNRGWLARGEPDVLVKRFEDFGGRSV